MRARRTQRALLFTPIVLFSFLACAHAEPPCAEPIPGDLARFCKADADRSGSLSQPEFLAAFPDLTDQAFLALDRDGNGLLDADEWRMHRRSHGGGQSTPSSNLLISPPKEP
ncbi:MAG: hypothetical protein IJU76_02065 [Desulfovibrionaceae bacterium]|nr:hypothetical protein [Desulfovibrionaceae bacterium]